MTTNDETASDAPLYDCARCGHDRYHHRPMCGCFTSFRYDERCPCDRFVERQEKR